MTKDKGDHSEGQAQPPPAPSPAPPLAPPPAGDHISVQVGEGASHVAAGKNIIQIGSLTVPRWVALFIVAALVLVVAGVGAVAWYNRQTSEGTQAVATILSNTPTPAPTPSPTPLPKLTGVVKMAVTALGYQDETGAITPLADRSLGENLSALLESAMRQESEDHLAQIQFKDYLSVGSYPTVLIGGGTAAEREQGAADLAQRANADLVVYGYVAPAGADAWDLQLYFYYYNAEIRAEPDAVSSSHLLGEAIPLQADPRKFPDQVLGMISNDLRLRGRALAWIGAGLYEDALNSPQNWQNALTSFQTGLQTLFPDAQSSANQGAAQLVAYQQQEDKYAAIRAVFHYFIGREALWLRNYDLALSEQQAAIAAKADYANAYHALGAIHFDRAQVYFSLVKQPVPPELLQSGCLTQAEVDHAIANAPAGDDEAWNDLDDAKTALQQALDLAGEAGQSGQPRWSHVANVTHLTLGLVRQIEAQAYLQDGQDQLAGDRLGKAQGEFQTALDGFSAQPGQKGYVGWSHLGLGMVDLIGADLADSGAADGTDGADPKALLQAAIAHYDACIDLGEPGNPNYFNKKVVECGCKYYKADAQRLLDAKG